MFKRMVVGGVAALVAAGVGMASPVSADTITVPVIEAYVSGEPGSTLEIGNAAIEADVQGRSCNVVAEVTNGGSVHPGNKLIVTSGDSRVEMDGIEDVADSVRTEGGSLTLGSTIEVSVMFGADGVSSLGSSLTLVCEALPAAPPAPPVPGEPTYTG